MVVLTKTTMQDEDEDEDQDQDLQKVALNGLKTKSWS